MKHDIPCFVCCYKPFPFKRVGIYSWPIGEQSGRQHVLIEGVFGFIFGQTAVGGFLGKVRFDLSA
jgi:hypothetical protein